MLFSSEVQHMQNYLSQLRDRLLLQIPEKISELNTTLQELDTKITNTQAEKALEQKRLAQLKPELKEKIEETRGKIKRLESSKEEIQIDINELQNRLDNMMTTHVIVSPEFSVHPVSPNQKLNVALGLVLGLFLSVFLAFITEFWQHNKERIKGGQAVAGEQAQG